MRSLLTPEFVRAATCNRAVSWTSTNHSVAGQVVTRLEYLSDSGLTRRELLQHSDFSLIQPYDHISGASWLSKHQYSPEITVWQDRVAYKMRLLLLYKLPDCLFGLALTGPVDRKCAFLLVRRWYPRVGDVVFVLSVCGDEKFFVGDRLGGGCRGRSIDETLDGW
jgi:hypothetical protein